jgi:hypothetical protein
MERKKSILGWIGVSLSLVISGLWAWWGAIENFHEGWYAETLWENLFMMVFQYLLFTIVFTVLALISLKWKKLGLALHLLTAGFCVWFFSGAGFQVLWLLIIIPFVLLGLVYYFGEPRPRKWAYKLIVALPLLIVMAITVPQGIKVSQRIDDGDLSARLVEGPGVALVWAPRGPGWPDGGVTWAEAQVICRHLSEDGTTVTESEQNIWRLPSADEAVRSMMLHGENAGGKFDPETGKAVYERTPDKESPLWIPHSRVIYYWTADSPTDNPNSAYIIVYHGGVFERAKERRYGYLSFRAVRDAGIADD